MESLLDQLMNDEYLSKESSLSEACDVLGPGEQLWDVTAADLQLGEPQNTTGDQIQLPSIDQLPLSATSHLTSPAPGLQTQGDLLQAALSQIQDEVMATPCSGAQDELLQMIDVADFLETAAETTVDVSSLHDADLKLEPRYAPSPDSSDSGVEGGDSCLFNFEYCDTPPVTPPQRHCQPTAPTSSCSQPTVLQLVEHGQLTQRGSPLVSVAVTPKVAIPALPRPQPPRKPARTHRPSTHSTAAAVCGSARFCRPAPEIRPRPAPAQLVTSDQLVTSAAGDDLLLVAPQPVAMTTELAEMAARAMKRRERMIRNRQAATLSRKKKKDQMTELEQRAGELETENQRLRTENQRLQLRLRLLNAEVETLRQSASGSATTHRPSPPSKRPLLLCGVLLFVALNVLPFRRLAVPPAPAASAPSAGRAAPPARTLLWSPSEDPAADLRQLTETVANATSGCSKFVNHTEAQRLSRVLHGWFDPSPASRAEPLNASWPADRWAADDDPGLLRCPGCSPGSGPPLPRQGGQHGSPRRPRRRRRRAGVDATAGRKLHSWAVQVYTPDWYGRLLEAIRRRDDTFYVVSFGGDHLMLPALHHNQTQRPRVSLLLPSPPLNESMRAPEHFVSMMQIDCEVINTKLLHIHESAIPDSQTTSNATGTNGRPPHYNFAPPPIDGFPVKPTLRWKGLGKRRRNADKKTPQEQHQEVTAQQQSAERREQPQTLRGEQRTTPKKSADQQKMTAQQQIREQQGAVEQQPAGKGNRTESEWNTMQNATGQARRAGQHHPMGERLADSHGPRRHVLAKNPHQAAVNVTGDRWRKLRLGNRSLDGGASRVTGLEALKLARGYGETLSSLAEDQQDYFQSEH